MILKFRTKLKWILIRRLFLTHSWDQTIQLCMGSSILLSPREGPKSMEFFGIFVPGLAPKMKVRRMSRWVGVFPGVRTVGFWKDLLLVGFCEKMMLYMKKPQKPIYIYISQCMFWAPEKSSILGQRFAAVVFWDVSHIQPTHCFRDAAVGKIASSPDLTLAKTENASVSSSRVLVGFQWRQYSCMNSREFTVFLQVFGNTMFWPAFTFIIGYVDTTHWKSFLTCFVLARHFSTLDPAVREIPCFSKRNREQKFCRAPPKVMFKAV